jgi:hypothetical protein
MVKSDRAESANYGTGGKAAGKAGSGSKQSGPGSSAKGSPLTRNIGSLADYEKKRTMPRAFDYVPSVANKAVTGKFFASEPEYQMKRDIKEAYQGYKPSPPSGGATRGLKGMRNAEVSRAIESKSRGGQ